MQHQQKRRSGFHLNSRNYLAQAHKHLYTGLTFTGLTTLTDILSRGQKKGAEFALRATPSYPKWGYSSKKWSLDLWNPIFS